MQRVVFFFGFVSINYILLWLFIHTYYLVYFFTLFFSLYFFVRSFISHQRVVVVGIVYIFCLGVFGIVKEELYQLCLDFGYDCFYEDLESGIFYLLSFFHLFILYLLGYNREKIMQG